MLPRNLYPTPRAAPRHVAPASHNQTPLNITHHTGTGAGANTQLGVGVIVGSDVVGIADGPLVVGRFGIVGTGALHIVGIGTLTVGACVGALVVGRGVVGTREGDLVVGTMVGARVV